MEITEYREQAAEIGLPVEMIESLINDYLRDSKTGEAVPLEELLDIAREIYPSGYIDPVL